MIERKDVKHDVPAADSFVHGIFSYVYLSELSNSKSLNEEAIRQKLYGDVVDALKAVRSTIGRARLQEVDRAITDLIAKLEWKDAP